MGDFPRSPTSLVSSLLSTRASSSNITGLRYFYGLNFVALRWGETTARINASRCCLVSYREHRSHQYTVATRIPPGPGAAPLAPSVRLPLGALARKQRPQLTPHSLLARPQAPSFDVRQPLAALRLGLPQ